MKIDAMKIRLMLTEQGLSMTAFSKNCGISRQSISTILARGTCKPKTADKLAKGLGVSVRVILKGDESNATSKSAAGGRICPMAFSVGAPVPCQSSCAWFIFPKGYDEGCCAIACLATSAHYTSGHIEEIMGEVSHATP